VLPRVEVAPLLALAPLLPLARAPSLVLDVDALWLGFRV